MKNDDTKDLHKFNHSGLLFFEGFKISETLSMRTK